MNEQEVHEVMGAWAISAGKATPEQVASSLESVLAGTDGFDPMAGAPVVSSHPSPTQTASAGEGEGESEDFDTGLAQAAAAAFAGPASAQEYRFDPPSMPIAAQDVEAVRELEAQWRADLHAAEVPPMIAKQFDTIIAAGLAKAARSPVTPVQVEMDRQALVNHLTKEWGDDRDRNVDIADRELARFAQRRPEILGLLTASGAIMNPHLVTTMYRLAVAKGRA